MLNITVIDKNHKCETECEKQPDLCESETKHSSKQKGDVFMGTNW